MTDLERLDELLGTPEVNELERILTKIVRHSDRHSDEGDEEVRLLVQLRLLRTRAGIHD